MLKSLGYFEIALVFASVTIGGNGLAKFRGQFQREILSMR
jgi:hypothetical protein